MRAQNVTLQVLDASQRNLSTCWSESHAGPRVVTSGVQQTASKRPLQVVESWSIVFEYPDLQFPWPESAQQSLNTSAEQSFHKNLSQHLSRLCSAGHVASTGAISAIRHTSASATAHRRTAKRDMTAMYVLKRERVSHMVCKTQPYQF